MNRINPCAAAVAVLLVVMLAAGTAFCAPSEKAPRAKFVSLKYTFEPVFEGEVVKHDFVVENVGNAPLVIKSIRPD
jgi:hypothetical protein